jgi:hypothetical protein
MQSDLVCESTCHHMNRNIGKMKISEGKNHDLLTQLKVEKHKFYYILRHGVLAEWLIWNYDNHKIIWKKDNKIYFCSLVSYYFIIYIRRLYIHKPQ